MSSPRIAQHIFSSVVSVCVALVLALSAAMAVEPDEVLDDPVLEERAIKISRNLRCVVCQSQSIDDSNAPLAKDMRIIVRERLVAGDSDEEVYEFLVSRYGDYVLLRPPMQGNTLVLWFAPILIFTIASLAVFMFFKSMQKQSARDESDIV